MTLGHPSFIADTYVYEIHYKVLSDHLYSILNEKKRLCLIFIKSSVERIYDWINV